MKLVIVVILQSLHLASKCVIFSLSEVVNHPDVALTVVRLVVALVMIVVIAVLVVSHCVFPSLSRVFYLETAAQKISSPVSETILS